jgi:peptide/nickel transport system substrate-binding protein
MYSANLLVTGDPLYNFNQTLAKSGPANYGAYENADLEKVLGQMRTESDPSKRSDLVTQAQKIIGTDFPDVYLVVIPFIVATSKKVTGYTLHPNDLYIIDDKIAVTGG